MMRKAALVAATLLLAACRRKLRTRCAPPKRSAGNGCSRCSMSASSRASCKHGIDVEISTMTGEARMKQALTAGSIDIGWPEVRAQRSR